MVCCSADALLVAPVKRTINNASVPVNIVLKALSYDDDSGHCCTIPEVRILEDLVTFFWLRTRAYIRHYRSKAARKVFVGGTHLQEPLL